MNPSDVIAPPASLPSPPWLPDLGDGTYRNPVLDADYSDPDVIRVGTDFWLTASSFSHVPGLPILHSSDLVNWTLVNHALPHLVPVEHFREPRHGAGVWAPALRYRNGEYWIFYPDPDFGLYLLRTTDPRGRWSDPVCIKAGRGLIDPCPFWDDDGTAYLVHGWARSRSGLCNRVTLHRMDARTGQILDEGQVIIDGDQWIGWHTIEGPKLYKRNGYYYVFAPAGGVATGYQAVFRARRIEGPYESHIALQQGSTAVNGPHQGAWVDAPDGREWFLHFQELPVQGRVVHLQPLRWINDWPVIGEAEAGHLTGQPVAQHAKPVPSAAAPSGPATSDAFLDGHFGRQWQWQANPDTAWVARPAQGPGLELRCVPHPRERSLWSAPHLLLQKFPAREFVAVTEVTPHEFGPGDTAGLIVFGHNYACLTLRRGERQLHLVLAQCLQAHQGGHEIELWSQPWTSGASAVLEVRITAGLCQFGHRDAAGHLQQVGPALCATSSYWVGAKIGLVATTPSPRSSGTAGFAWFHVSASR